MMGWRLRLGGRSCSSVECRVRSEMEIGPLANREVVTVGPAHTLAEAARRMTARGVGSAVVLTEDGRPGIITERDLMRAIAEDADVATTPVESYMTANAITATSSWDSLRAASAMLEGGFRHLVVVDEAGTVDGILSIRDLFRSFLDETALQ